MSILRRFLSLSRTAPQRLYGTSTYEGDGKTTATILNDEAGSGVMINAYSQVGFRLNNDVTVLGSVVIFPRTVFSWAVQSPEYITEESLSLFPLIEPKLDIIILGIGDKTKDLTFFTKLLPFARKYKLNLEVLPTNQACSTFNFLTSEGRYVAGGFIPPQHIETNEDDLLQTKMRYQRIYEVKDDYM